MEHVGEEDDILNQINFDDLLNNFDFDIFLPSSPSVSSSWMEMQQSQSPTSSSWVCEIEEMLMKDDDNTPPITNTNHEDFSTMDFFSDVLPVDDQLRVDNSSTPPPPPHSNTSSDFQEKEGTDEETRVFNPNDSSFSDDSSQEKQKQKQKQGSNDASLQNNDDPITKKRKRQIRNRDAAVRSRERKKFYVRDLEMKSRYLEGECIRLQRLLQCCFAENHALHLQLQGKAAFGASKAKQESAVLFLESLLLGSLLWFLGIVGLCSLLPLLHLILPAVVLANVGGNNQEVVELASLRRAGSERRIGLGSLRLFFKSKRCKASRSKMKTMFLFGAVLA